MIKMHWMKQCNIFSTFKLNLLNWLSDALLFALEVIYRGILELEPVLFISLQSESLRPETSTRYKQVDFHTAFHSSLHLFSPCMKHFLHTREYKDLKKRQITQRLHNCVYVFALVITFSRVDLGELNYWNLNLTWISSGSRSALERSYLPIWKITVFTRINQIPGLSTFCQREQEPKWFMIIVNFINSAIVLNC